MTMILVRVKSILMVMMTMKSLIRVGDAIGRRV